METIDRTAAIRHREYGASRKQVTSKALRHNTSVWVPWLAFEKRLAKECVSNHYLDSAHVLTKAQMDVLVAKAARLAVRTLADGRS